MGYNSIAHLCAGGDVPGGLTMQTPKPKIAAVYGVLSAAWIGVLFFFSGQSGEESGRLSEKLTRWLFGALIERGADAAQLEHLLRKAAHFGVFAVAGFLICMTLLHLLRRRGAVWAALAAGCVLAVANELHQTLSEGRSCQFTDMLIDASGAALGLTAAALIVGWIAKRQTHRDRKGYNG